MIVDHSVLQQSCDAKEIYSWLSSEYFYEELQKVLDKTPKKDILVVQGDWNAKIGEEACKDWKGICGYHCNTKSNDRGRQLLEFASCNDLVVANTFGPHKTS